MRASSAEQAWLAAAGGDELAWRGCPTAAVGYIPFANSLSREGTGVPAACTRRCPVRLLRHGAAAGAGAAINQLIGWSKFTIRLPEARRCDRAFGVGCSLPGSLRLSMAVGTVHDTVITSHGAPH